jgi:hypothetical protein
MKVTRSVNPTPLRYSPALEELARESFSVQPALYFFFVLDWASSAACAAASRAMGTRNGEQLT